MSKKNSQKLEQDPQVYKEEEYAVFLGLIADGLWKNNRFLAEVCGVNEETIADWKKRQEVQVFRRKAIGETLKKWKRTADAEKLLKEQGMDFDPDRLDITTGGKPLLGGSTTNALPDHNSN